MSDIENWLNNTKQEKPELSDFIMLVESFFSETGFNASAFEKTVTAKLNLLKKHVEKSLEDEENAKG
jgi:hypothetical protein